MNTDNNKLNPPTSLGAAPLLDRCFIQLEAESGVVLSLTVRLPSQDLVRIAENLKTYSEGEDRWNGLKILLEELSRKLCEQIEPAIDRMTRASCMYVIKQYELERSNSIYWP